MNRATIVIPVFNRAHLVHRAIDTALAQTVPCEVILADHGSTDRIAEVAGRYQGRIRYLRRERDQGPVACWRDGIAHATTDFVHLTYDDDWLQPTFIERCLELMRDDVAFAYTRVTLHFEPSGKTEPSVLHPPGVRPIGPLVQHLLRARYTVSPGCALFRRRDAMENLLPEVPGATGPYGKGKGVGEDLLLFLLTSLGYEKYAHVEAPLADFLAHPGSITIGAMVGGKARALAAAYETAKRHYLAQTGSLRRERGARTLASRARWLLESKAMDQYARKALGRLR